MRPTDPTSAGFTLLELLLALALGGLLLAGVYGSFFSLSTATLRAREEMEATRSIRGTLDLVRRELSSARFRRGSEGHRFILLDRDRFGKPASVLTFATLTPPSPQGVEDQAIVTWRTIEREERLILVRESIPAHRLGDPVAYPQMEDITGFLVECFDGAKWIRTWDSTVNGRLPDRVRITITRKEGESERSYTISTPIAAGGGT